MTITINQFSKSVNRIESSFIRDILTVSQQPEIISFAGGLPDPNLFPLAELEQAYKSMTQNWGGLAFQYGETQGSIDLRNYIADSLVNDAELTPNQVMICTGSQQGLDILARVTLNEGDTVLVESPTYLGALQVFNAAGANIVSVEMDSEGPVLTDLSAKLNNSVKVFYVMPNFQNPTGSSWSKERRAQIVKLISQYDTILAEDDPYSSLRYSGESLPSLYSLLPTQTVRFNTFSKAIAPSFRLGWVQAPEILIKTMCKMKQVTDLNTSCINQYHLLEFLKAGFLEGHVEKLVGVYSARQQCMLEQLSKKLSDHLTWTMPEGGMFIWCSLKDGSSARVLFDKAIKQGVAFVPGVAFYGSDGGESEFRLNFTNSTLEDIKEGIDRLKNLISQV